MNLESKPTAWYSCMLTPRTEVPSELPSEHKLPSVSRFEEFYVRCEGHLQNPTKVANFIYLVFTILIVVQCQYILRLLHLIQHYSRFYGCVTVMPLWGGTSICRGLVASDLTCLVLVQSDHSQISENPWICLCPPSIKITPLVRTQLTTLNWAKEVMIDEANLELVPF